MTFSDIFKSNFLANVTSVTVLDMLLALVLSFGIGLFIYLIYKKTYAGVMYSSSFGVTLIGMTMVSTFVILAVTSNVVLSLGMVGALSIVRFRTAIKEPLDIVFLLWAIAAGIGFALLVKGKGIALDGGYGPGDEHCQGGDTPEGVLLNGGQRRRQEEGGRRGQGNKGDAH